MFYDYEHRQTQSPAHKLSFSNIYEQIYFKISNVTHKNVIFIYHWLIFILLNKVLI